METVDERRNIHPKGLSMGGCRLSCSAQCRNGGGIVPAAENSRTGDEDVSSCCDDLRRIVHLDASIHFEHRVPTAAIDHLPNRCNFLQRGWNEGLSSET